jgi:transposase
VSDTELLPKSKPEQPSPVRRVEVFTGAGRRRNWTADQKAQIVAESCENGETVSAVARRHGLTPQQLFGWRRASRQHAEREVGENGAGFTPVVVEASRSHSDVLATALSGGSPKIEIVIGAATVRVPRGIDAVTLATVLRAVKAAA